MDMLKRSSLKDYIIKTHITFTLLTADLKSILCSMQVSYKSLRQQYTQKK